MKTYLSSIITKLQQQSEKLDNAALLTSKHWVVIDDETAHKVTYIFRTNGDLLISQVGEVQKAKWDYLGNQTLLIDRGEKSHLFKHGFLNEQVLALKVDGRDEYALLVTENQFERGINTLQQVTTFLDSLLPKASPTIAPPVDEEAIMTEKKDPRLYWLIFAVIASLLPLFSAMFIKSQ